MGARVAMIFDIALLLGVVTSLLKGVDLVLTQVQRQQIQAFFEDLTLRVDDLDYDRWIRSIGTPGVQAVFVGVIYIEFLILATLGVVFRVWENAGREWRWLLFLWCVVTLGTLLFAWHWPLPRLMRWLVADGRRLGIFVRQTLLSLTSLTLLGLSAAALWAAGLRLSGDILAKTPTGQHWYMLGALLVWPPLLVLWTAIHGGDLVLHGTSWYGRWTVRLIIGLFKGTLWKLVGYKEGVAGGLVLVATITLGIAKLMISGK